MGTDFVVSRAKAFRRSWDRGLSQLSAPDLFSAQPKELRQTYSGTPKDEHTFELGQQCLLRPAEDNKSILILTEADEVGRINSPPSTLIDIVHGNGCGVAIGVVERIHPISGLADIAIK